jgi:fatty-acyl-CoA synthase
MAGSPCPTEVMKRVVEQMNLREITIAYGMTETSPVSCQSSTDTPLDKRVSTVGQVQPHLEIKIVDPETGAIVPRGQRGEFCTKGYSVMHGYWGDEPRRAKPSTPTAGCTPATWPPWTPRATSTSSAASRTW